MASIELGVELPRPSHSDSSTEFGRVEHDEINQRSPFFLGDCEFACLDGPGTRPAEQQGAVEDFAAEPRYASRDSGRGTEDAGDAARHATVHLTGFGTGQELRV